MASTAKRFGIGYAPDGWSNVLDKFGKSPEATERLLATGLIIRKDNGNTTIASAIGSCSPSAMRAAGRSRSGAAPWETANRST